MPGYTEDSKKIIKYLYETYGNHIYISILSQFTPLNGLKEYPELKSRIMERILRILQAPDYKIMITLRENSASLHDLKPKLVEYIKRNI